MRLWASLLHFKREADYLGYRRVSVELKRLSGDLWVTEGSFDFPLNEASSSKSNASDRVHNTYDSVGLHSAEQGGESISRCTLTPPLLVGGGITARILSATFRLPESDHGIAA